MDVDADAVKIQNIHITRRLLHVAISLPLPSCIYPLLNLWQPILHFYNFVISGILFKWNHMSVLLLQTVVDGSQNIYALLFNYKYECRVYERLEGYKVKEVDKGWIINAI